MNLNGIKTYFNWSTGKDSALALHHLLQNDHYQVDQLLTTINSHHDRVTMHGLHRDLLLQQVEAIGLPLKTIELPAQPSMEDYDAKLKKGMLDLKREGYSHSAFGDIFLEDLKAYREKQMTSVGIKGVFPIWQRDTTELLEEFISLGFKAVVVCIKVELLDDSFLGKEIDHDFLRKLPQQVDPCGENGEFHTFCYDGPIFSSPVNFVKGEKIYRSYNRPKTDESSSDPSMQFGFIDLEAV